MISEYIIKHISTQSTDKHQFERYFNKLYNDTTIDLFLIEFMNDFVDEYIDFDNFFDEKRIAILKDDNLIRYRLETMSLKLKE